MTAGDSPNAIAIAMHSDIASIAKKNGILIAERSVKTDAAD